MQLVILGGGIVGLTVASLLAAENNLQITIVDAKQPYSSWDTDNYDLRCSAINPASQQIFCSLQIWDSIVQQRFAYYNKMQVWDASGMAKIEFDAQDTFSAHLGYIIENRVILNALYKNLQDYKNVDFIHAEADSPKVKAQILKSKLVVGADGANSLARRLANINISKHDYNQTAIVAVVKTELPHRNIAKQKFSKRGPLAFLPLDKPNLCSIVWSVPTDLASKFNTYSDEEFCLELQSEFADQYGDLELVSKRAGFALKAQHAETYIAERLAIIGDAAHVIHPLAGQGLNLGIQDGVVLAAQLLSAVKQQRDIGSRFVLRKFERARKGHNLLVLQLMTALNNTFAWQQAELSALRNFGINTLNRLVPIKALLQKSAMGING